MPPLTIARIDLERVRWAGRLPGSALETIPRPRLQPEGPRVPGLVPRHQTLLEAFEVTVEEEVVAACGRKPSREPFDLAAFDDLRTHSSPP